MANTNNGNQIKIEGKRNRDPCLTIYSSSAPLFVDGIMEDDNTPLLTRKHLKSAPLLGESNPDAEGDMQAGYGSVEGLPNAYEADISKSLLDPLVTTSLTRRPDLRRSMEGSLLVTLIEKLVKKRDSTLILAVWNMLPALQGSAVFSMPYAIARGGYSVIIVILLMSWATDATGCILTDCLYEESPHSKKRKRVRLDYVDIADSAFGKHGARLLNFVLIFYLFTGDVVNMLLIAKSVFDVLHPYTSLSFAVLTIIFSIPCYPALFIERLSVMAYLSMTSVFAVFVAIVAIMSVFISQNAVWAHNANLLPFFDPEGFPLAVGITMFSVITHSVLPQIEGSMKDPTEINKAIHISYGVSAIFKSIAGLFGALTYGALTLSVVTINTGTSSVALRILCGLMLTTYGICNFPLQMFIVCESVDGLMEGTRFGRDGSRYPSLLWRVSTRFFLLAACVVLSLFVPYFGILIALRGSICGTFLLFVFPCLCHLKLKWNNISRVQKAVDIFLLVVGSVVGAVAIYSSFRNLVAAMMSNKGHD